MKEEILNAIVKTLIEKNRRYGNAALDPIHCFYKGSATHSIEIRLDDKISRIKNSGKPRKNDMYDILGYLFLYVISKNYGGVQFYADDFKKQLEIIRGLVLEEKVAIHDVPDGYFNDFMNTLEFIRGYESGVTDTIVFMLMGLIVAWFEANNVTDFSDLID